MKRVIVGFLAGLMLNSYLIAAKIYPSAFRLRCEHYTITVEPASGVLTNHVAKALADFLGEQVCLVDVVVMRNK